MFETMGKQEIVDFQMAYYLACLPTAFARTNTREIARPWTVRRMYRQLMEPRSRRWMDDDDHSSLMLYRGYSSVPGPALELQGEHRAGTWPSYEHRLGKHQLTHVLYTSGKAFHLLFKVSVNSFVHE